MFDKINDIIAKMNLTVLLIACVAVVALVFIVGLALTFATGEHNKFKAIAKKALSKPVVTVFNETAKQMPVKVRKQYKTFKQTGAKPGDVITVDACVYSPYTVSVASKFGGTMSVVAIIMPLICLMLAHVVVAKMSSEAMAAQSLNIYTATALVAAAGLLLRLIAGVIGMANLKGAVKVYDKYIGALEKAVKGGDREAPEQPIGSVTADDIMTGEPLGMDDIPPLAMEDVSEAVPFEQQQPEQPVTFGATFDEPTRITVELADEDEPVIVPQPQEDAAAEKARAREAAMAAAREEQARIQAEARAKAEAEAKAKADAEAKMRAEAKARADAELRARAAQAAQAAQAQATQPMGGSGADDVIARIEKINREGAPLATMKEVALALQQERAKPENKTPEQQRKLNEALASLLKAMSSATKR